MKWVDAHSSVDIQQYEWHWHDYTINIESGLFGNFVLTWRFYNFTIMQSLPSGAIYHQCPSSRNRCAIYDFLITGILWVCRWSSPSIRIFPHTCWFVTEMQIFHNWRLKNKMFCFLLSYCFCFCLFLILHTFCSVLTCDILGIGLL